jgi:RHS repeat-associated protein
MLRMSVPVSVARGRAKSWWVAVSVMVFAALLAPVTLAAHVVHAHHHHRAPVRLRGADRVHAHGRYYAPPPVLRAGRRGGHPVALVAPSGKRGARARAAVATAGAREIGALRTETSRTFLMPDGRYFAQIFAEPVNYRDAQGRWQQIDDSLVPVDGPGMPQAVAAFANRLGITPARAAHGRQFRNRSDAYRLRLPGSLENGWVRFANQRGDAVSFALLGARGQGRVRGNTESFAGALPGVRVSYAAETSGLKESLTLRGAGASKVFGYRLRLSHGLRARLRRNGEVRFVNPRGHTALRFPAPSMVDAGHPSRLHRVAVRLHRRASGLELVYDARGAWTRKVLARGHRVVVDPGATVSPSQDCVLDSGAPTVSSCTGTIDYVGASSGRDHHTLMQFNITGAVPQNAEIEEAWVQMHLASTSTSGSQAVGVYGVTRPWTTSASWNKSDGTTSWTTPGGDTDATPLRTQTVSSTGLGFYYWQISDLFRQWQNGGTNNGVLFKQTGSSSVEMRFDSNHATNMSNRPSLGVYYEQRLGQQKGYPIISQQLTDRSSLAVNAANGNLMVHSADETLPGAVGVPLAITRDFNNLQGWLSGTGQGWLMSPGPWDNLHVDADGYSVYYEGPGGVVRPFTKNSDGTYSSPPGIDATLTDDSSGAQTAFKLMFHDSGTIMRFTGAGANSYEHLQYIHDRNDSSGSAISFTYNGSGQLTSMSATPSGLSLTFAYNGSGYVSSVTDTDANDSTKHRVWQYGYTGTRLTSVTDPNTKVTSYEYDGSGDLTKITDPAGHVTLLTYVNPAGGDVRVKTITRTTDVNNTTGPTWTFNYYGADTTTCGTTTNNLGKTIVTDPLGHNTTYCYDTGDRSTSVIDANGNVAGASYTPNSDPSTTTDQGHTTSFQYDGNATTPSTYDPTAANNMTKATEPAGGVVTATYPSISTPTNPDRYLASPVVNEQGSSVFYTYDTAGNLTLAGDSASNPANKAALIYNGYSDTTCGTDTGSIGTLKCATDGNLHKTIYGYTNGQVTSITPDATGHAPLIGATTLTYDGYRRLSTVTDPDLRMQTFFYDPLDRVTEIDFGNTSNHKIDYVTYTYDANGNRTQQFDSNASAGTSSYAFDKLNRVTEEDKPGGVSTFYTWDDASNLTKLDDGPGTTAVVNYDYDPANRLKDIVDPGGSCTGTISKCTRYSYDDVNHNKFTITQPNGVVLTYHLDGDGKVTQITAPNDTTPTLENLIYSYDAGSTHTTLRQSVDDAITHLKTFYTYDPLDRLTDATVKTNDGGTGATVNAEYHYVFDPTVDKASNRTEQDITNSSGAVTKTFYAYSADNQLCWYVTQASAPTQNCNSTPTGASAVGYDSRGDQTTGGPSGTLSYNHRAQTTGIAGTGVTYNGPGQADWLTEGSNFFLHDLLGTATKDPGPGPAYFTRDPTGAPMTDREPSGNSYYYLHDALGSVVGLTDSSGAKVKSYSYDPFGNITSKTGTGPDQPFGFADGYQAAGGLLHFGQRYYDPRLGRWTQPDILENPSSLTEANHYLYGGDDPVNMTDPSGELFNPAASGTLMPNTTVKSTQKLVNIVCYGRSAKLGVTAVGEFVQVARAGMKVITVAKVITPLGAASAVACGVNTYLHPPF